GNPDLNGLRSFGNLYSMPLLLFDTQAGYWFYQNPDPGAMVSSVAGVLELHYNTALASGGTLEFDGLTARNLLSNFSIVNMTVGTTVAIGEQPQLMAGPAFPLSRARSFDYEFAFYINRFFGRTARARANRTPAPSLF